MRPFWKTYLYLEQLSRQPSFNVPKVTRPTRISRSKVAPNIADPISIKNSDSRLKSNPGKGGAGESRELVVLHYHVYVKDVSSET